MALDIKHEQLDVKFSYLIFCHIRPSIAFFGSLANNALSSAHFGIRMTPILIVVHLSHLVEKIAFNLPSTK